MKHKRGALLGALIAVPALIAAGIGVASASIPSSTAGTFYGCVKGPDSADPGTLIIKDDEGTGEITCGSDATQVQWSQTPVDSGIVTAESGTCVLSDLHGPDAANLTTSLYAGGICEVSGFPDDAVVTATINANPTDYGGGPAVVDNLGSGSWIMQSATFMASPGGSYP